VSRRTRGGSAKGSGCRYTFREGGAPRKKISSGGRTSRTKESCRKGKKTVRDRGGKGEFISFLEKRKKNADLSQARLQ